LSGRGAPSIQRRPPPGLATEVPRPRSAAIPLCEGP